MFVQQLIGLKASEILTFVALPLLDGPNLLDFVPKAWLKGSNDGPKAGIDDLIYADSANFHQILTENIDAKG